MGLQAGAREGTSRDNAGSMQATVSPRPVLILGLLLALGPVAIDMYRLAYLPAYLSALPRIGASLGAQVGGVAGHDTQGLQQ
ncbi:hypothetical protein GCM10010975_32000 [Comamonas phosphati]|nr:hypothetical protein GCM10010975_32000 [Comamonas phosphati]